MPFRTFPSRISASKLEHKEAIKRHPFASYVAAKGRSPFCMVGDRLFFVTNHIALKVADFSMAERTRRHCAPSAKVHSSRRPVDIAAIGKVFPPA